MRIGIAITTKKRANEFDYLIRMLRDMRTSGVFINRSYRVTVSESGSLYPEEIPGFLSEFPEVEKLTSDIAIFANQNVAKAILQAASHAPDYVMYMNDDSRVAKSFSFKVIQFLQRYQQYPCWSFYCPYDEPMAVCMERKEDLFVYPYHTYYGSLCWVMRRDDAVAYAKHLHDYFLSGYREGMRLQGGDLQLAEYLKKTYPDKHIAAHVPSLVNHNGKHSTLVGGYAAPGYYHESNTFTGA